eukprot:357785-Ditylum_brightwellii.AAC.1
MIGDSSSLQNKNSDKENGEEAKANNADRYQQLLQEECEMSLLDDKISKLSEARNKIKLHILEIQSVKHDANYGSFSHANGSLDSRLDDIDDWIFTAECDNATLQEIESNLNDIINKYFEKKKWDDSKKDLDKAGKTAPDNKAIQKLQARLDQQIK